MSKKLFSTLLAVSAFSFFCFISMAMAQNIDIAAKSAGEGRKVIKLEAMGGEPDAGGVAKIEIRKGRKSRPPLQEFLVIGTKLQAGTTYTLIVDGNTIGSAVAEDSSRDKIQAGVEFKFSSRVKDPAAKMGDANPLPMALDPVTNIRHVELRDANNQVVVVGDFMPE